MPTVLYKYLAMLAVVGGLLAAILWERNQVLKLQLEISNYKASVATASEAARERRAADAKTSKEIDDENLARVHAMSGTITALLLRKPPGVPATSSGHPEGSALPADPTPGPASGRDPGVASCGDIAAVAELGWQQVKLWRKYARETGQVDGPQ